MVATVTGTGAGAISHQLVVNLCGDHISDSACDTLNTGEEIRNLEALSLTLPHGENNVVNTK